MHDRPGAPITGRRSGILLNQAAAQAWRAHGGKRRYVGERLCSIDLSVKGQVYSLVSGYAPVSSLTKERVVYFEECEDMRALLPNATAALEQSAKSKGARLEAVKQEQREAEERMAEEQEAYTRALHALSAGQEAERRRLMADVEAERERVEALFSECLAQRQLASQLRERLSPAAAPVEAAAAPPTEAPPRADERPGEGRRLGICVCAFPRREVCLI